MKNTTTEGALSDITKNFAHAHRLKDKNEYLSFNFDFLHI